MKHRGLGKERKGRDKWIFDFLRTSTGRVRQGEIWRGILTAQRRAVGGHARARCAVLSQISCFFHTFRYSKRCQHYSCFQVFIHCHDSLTSSEQTVQLKYHHRILDQRQLSLDRSEFDLSHSSQSGLARENGHTGLQELLDYQSGYRLFF